MPSRQALLLISTLVAVFLGAVGVTVWAVVDKTEPEPEAREPAPVERQSVFQPGPPRPKAHQTRANLRAALTLVLERLRAAGVPSWAMFGSALGAAREGGPIEGDDDIDLAVDRKYYAQAVACLDCHFRDPRHAFLQTRVTPAGAAQYVPVDLYFYHHLQPESGPEVLAFPWHFGPNTGRPADALHVPADLVFPLTEGADFGGVPLDLPADLPALAQYLYGPRWRTPMAAREYHTNLTLHRPVVTYHDAVRGSAYWDQFYGLETAPAAPSPFATWVAGQLAAAPPGALLDVGCGNGRDTRRLAPLATRRAAAWDLSAEAIARNSAATADATARVEWAVQDLAALEPPADPEWDVIYCRWVLHSLDAPTLDRFLTWVEAALRPGGRFFAEARTVRDPLYGRGVRGGQDPDAFVLGHYRRFLRPDALEARLTRSGRLVLTHFEAGDAFSVRGADRPHLLRLVAHKPAASPPSLDE